VIDLIKAGDARHRGDSSDASSLPRHRVAARNLRKQPVPPR
jgi:hypothetical protein